MAQDVIYVPDRDEGKPPSGQCSCPREQWHRHDSPSDQHPVSCLQCGAHWWMANGREIAGPPFTPYAEVLAMMGQLPVRNTRRPPPPGILPGRFPKTAGRWNYWNIPALNPWAGSRDGLPGPYEFNPTRPDEAAHEALEQEYGSRVAAGDEAAVFEYVYIDAHAFRSSWLITLLEDW